MSNEVKSCYLNLCSFPNRRSIANGCWGSCRTLHKRGVMDKGSENHKDTAGGEDLKPSCLCGLSLLKGNIGPGGILQGDRLVDQLTPQVRAWGRESHRAYSRRLTQSLLSLGMQVTAIEHFNGVIKLR